MAAKLPGFPDAIKRVPQIIGPYLKEIVYKISVCDLLQNIDSQEVIFFKTSHQRAMDANNRLLFTLEPFDGIFLYEVIVIRAYEYSLFF